MLKLPNVQRRRRLRKRQLKSVFAMLQTLSRLLYLVQFQLSNVGEFDWSWILRDCIKVHEKKKKRVVFLRLRPPQNVKLRSFTS